MPESALDHVSDLAEALTVEEKLALIGSLVQQVRRQFPSTPRDRSRLTRGALADLGPAPSAEEIDEARKEAWAVVSVEDVG